MPPRLKRLFVPVVAGAVLAVAVSLAFVVTTTPPAGWRLALALAFFTLGDATLLHIRFRRDHISFTWAELSLLLALALVPGAWLIPTCFLGVAITHSLGRRGPMKVAFNASAFTLGALLSFGVVRLVGGAAYPVHSVRTAVGLVLAGLVFAAWNSVVITAAVAWSQDLTYQQVFRTALGLRAGVALSSTLIGVAILSVASWRPSTLIVIPPLLVLAYVCYRAYLRAMHERDTWQQLESASRELSRLLERDVAVAAVKRAALLLGADRVEVLVHHRSEPGVTTVYIGDETGVSSCVEVTTTGGDSHGPVRVVGLEQSDQQPLGSVQAVPLIGPVGDIGALRIGFERPQTLTDRQRQVLSTFAHTVSTCLENARLYDDMRHQAEVKAHEASHDHLTGLPNRGLLTERATEALDRGVPCSLLLIDLDHFKQINDTLGHAAGDVVLQRLSSRLRAGVGLSDTVARLGGDEFAVLLIGEAGAGADKVASNLLRLMADPVEYDGLRLSVEGSIGVASFPADGATFSEILQRADVAMYQAKDSRGSFRRYRSDLDDSSVARLALVAELRSALEEDHIDVHFQPQIDLATGEVAGLEALARWQHPTRGLVPPGDFIAAVEHSGLVRSFTLRVLDKAVAEAALWHRLGRPVTVAVNLSARNLLDRDLPTDVLSVLARHGLDPASLVLEITETTMMSQLEVVEEVLGALRRASVQLSVDDFGTGYSSLAFLQRVSVNELKVDRCFVQNLTTSASDKAIVRGTVQLARSLGLRTVAEGVEDAETLALLTSMGATMAQGYHLAKPAPAASIRSLLGIVGPQVPRQAEPRLRVV